MSGTQLRVDYNRLGELQQNLDLAVRVVGAELENTNSLSMAVGDGRLSSRTREFRDSWDKRRLEIVGNLEWLRDSVKNICEQLEEADATLASGLTDAGADGA